MLKKKENFDLEYPSAPISFNEANPSMDKEKAKHVKACS